MRIRFDAKKDKMYGFLKLMKEEVQTAMERALKAIEKHDPKLARRVLEHDVYLDRYRYQLENYCGTIIATQSPVASELKELLVGIKLAGIFERMGDYACHLVQSLDEKTNYIYLERYLESFKSMITIGHSMLNGAMEAYFSSDLSRLKSFQDEDDDIDAIYDKNYEEAIVLIEKKSSRRTSPFKDY